MPPRLCTGLENPTQLVIDYLSRELPVRLPMWNSVSKQTSHLSQLPRIRLKAFKTDLKIKQKTKRKQPVEPPLLLATCRNMIPMVRVDPWLPWNPTNRPRRLLY